MDFMQFDDPIFSQWKALGDDNEQHLPEEEIRLLKASYLLHVVLPGKPLDFRLGNTGSLLNLLRAVGRSHGALGRIYEGHINALYLIHLYASEQQQKKWYRQVEEDRLLFGVWNTDGEQGLCYQLKHEHVLVEGVKTFCSGAGLVDRALLGGKVMGLGESNWQMAIIPMEQVPMERIDFASWEPMGMKLSASFTVDFSGIAIPRDQLLGKLGDYLKQPYFNGGAIRFVAVQLGMAETVYNKTLAYLRALERLEDPFQRMRLGQMAMALQTGRLWVQEAGKHFDLEVPNADRHKHLVAFVNMARLVVEEQCLKVIEMSAKCIGARGLLAKEGIERWHRDLAYYLRQPAPDATLQNVALMLNKTEMPIEELFEYYESMHEAVQNTTG